VKPSPRDFIESYVGGSDYWSNNIRKEFRLTSPPQIAFCDGFKNLLLELMVYVKAHHTTGVAWNSTKKGLVRATDSLYCIAEKSISLRKRLSSMRPPCPPHPLPPPRPLLLPRLLLLRKALWPRVLLPRRLTSSVL
jgi:hypothetical protein